MSAWRLSLKELHEAGGTAPWRTFGCYKGRAQLAQMGLATHTPLPRNGIQWTLTKLGWDVAEGKLVQREVRPGGRYWCATWLMSLPRLSL